MSGIYVSALPEMSLGDDFIATIQGQPVPAHVATISKTDGHVLEIDVKAAWKEMGLQAGFSNEVEVLVYTNMS